MKTEKLEKRLGIIGGGQLGKMLLSECHKMNISTSVLDPSDKSPCRSIADKFTLGDFNNFDDVYNFGKDCDIITFEIEHINVKALEALEEDGKKVFPKSKTLKIIQDKNIQKSFFVDQNIPTANFKFYKSINDLKQSFNNSEITFPCVWKKTKFGYDGFGVKILKSFDDIKTLPDTEMIIEDLVSFEKELSVIVTRNLDGEANCFEAVEMEFNSVSNQVEFVISPANIPNKVNKKAKELAFRLADALDLVGVLAVEMFMTNDAIFVNEIAPRPHNSGHFSIEACDSSQFQQHLRAIFNLNLGNTKHDGCAIMINLVGEENYNGEVYYENLDSVFKVESANLHIYGKKETRPNRKMGHVTIICDKFEEAYEKAKHIKKSIKVKTKK
tara:strand:- start:2495 stop:3649 length:1155 start_codon:yes stop_codon:yes gene_type:complete